MARIILSIAFVLAAAAIAAVVAQPICESHEFAGDVVPQHHNCQPLHDVAIPEQPSPESTSE